MKIHLFFIVLMPFAVWASCIPPYEQVGEKCLYIEQNQAMPFAEAREFCLEMEYGVLATITTATQFKEMVDYFNSLGLEWASHWLNGKDEKTEGNWVSSFGNNVPMGTPFWAATGYYQEPDGGRSENCLQVGPGFYLNDIKCDALLKPLCEYWLPNETSFQEKSSTSTSCPMHSIELHGKCISFMTSEELSWADARDSCQEEGGQLATVNDIELLRDIYLYLNVTGLNTRTFWIGGSDEAVEGEWKWLDGSDVPQGSPYWGLSTTGLEPDGGEEENNLSLIWEGSYYFRDLGGDSLCNPLCELPQE